MGRTTGKPVLKFDPTDDSRARLKWHDVKRGEQGGGSVLAAFELYLVGPVKVMHDAIHL